jgi:branched-chain amino acid transport system substrate-binding protein
VARAEAAATQGEGVLVLSAAPAVGRVPGSAEFAARYQARYRPIATYAVNSYDSALSLPLTPSASLTLNFRAA